MIELLLLIIITIIAFLSGRILLDKIKLDLYGKAETLLYSTSAGLGLISFIILVLGFTGLLFKEIIWGITIVSFVFLIFKKGKSGVEFLKNIQFKNLFSNHIWMNIIIVLTFLYVLYNLLRCLTPVVNGDSIAWYLSVPKHFIENHSVMNKQLTVDYFSSNLPLNIYMLSVYGMVLKSEILSQLILGWLMSVLCFFTIYVIIKRFASWKYAFLGATFFYTMPTFAWLIFSAKLDVGYTMFELCFWSLFLKWLVDKNNRTLYISAIFLGFAIGSKYHALIALTCAAIIIIVSLFYRKESFIKVIRVTFIFSIISLIIGSPSYLKTWFFTGDPFFPFFSDPDLVEGEGFDIYNGLKDYPRFLYHMIFKREFLIGKVNYFCKPFGFLPILFIPFLFFKNIFNSIPKSVLFTILFYFGVISIAIMNSVWPFPRHFLPGFGLITVISAISSVKLSEVKFKKVYAFFILFSLLGTLIYYSGFSRSLFSNQVKFLTGSLSKTEYLKETLFKSGWHMNYEMLEYVKKMDKDARIVTLDFGNGYYVDRPFLKKGYVYMAKTYQELFLKLEKDNITHIYFSKPILEKYVSTWYDGKPSIILSAIEDGFFLLENTSDDQLLYRLNYDKQDSN